MKPDPVAKAREVKASHPETIYEAQYLRRVVEGLLEAYDRWPRDPYEATSVSYDSDRV